MFCHPSRLNLDGTGLTAITRNALFDGDPAWSPDGTKIGFTRGAGPEQEFELHVNLTHGHYAWGGGMAWSPDGSHLAIVTAIDGGRDIVILDDDGGFVRRIAYSTIEKRDLAWSPDGSHIAYAAGPHPDGRWNYDIYVVASDGSNERRLTTHPAFDVQPSWAPDGRRLAFLSERSGGSDVYLMNLDGSGITRVRIRRGRKTIRRGPRAGGILR